MYLVRFENGNKCLIAPDLPSFYAVINLLENSKTSFKVYAFDHCVMPTDFGLGDYKYWLSASQCFV